MWGLRQQSFSFTTNKKNIHGGRTVGATISTMKQGLIRDSVLELYHFLKSGESMHNPNPPTPPRPTLMNMIIILYVLTLPKYQIRIH